MNDPMRLVDGEATEFERLLLRAAAEERPSSELSARMLAGAVSAGAAVAFLSNAPVATGGLAGGEGVLGPGVFGPGVFGPGIGQVGSAVGGGVGGSIVPPAAAGLLGTWVVKWGVLTALVAGLGVSGWAVLGAETAASGAPQPHEAERAAPTQALAVSQSEPAAQPLEAQPRVPLATTSQGKRSTEVPASRPVRTQKPALGPEIELLDSARRALAAGDAERALTLIKSYRRRFPSGALGQEATVLEVDALAAKGRSEQATDLRQQFVAEHPESTHVDRVQRSGGAR